MKVLAKRGEVWLIDFGMVEKVRPALVLSAPPGSTDRNILTVIPHTTTLRGSEFEISVQLPFLRPGAFLAQSPATVAAVRAEKYLGQMSNEEIRRVEDALLRWLMIARA
jgi:mRNA interferase MazF